MYFWYRCRTAQMSSWHTFYCHFVATKMWTRWQNWAKLSNLKFHGQLFSLYPLPAGIFCNISLQRHRENESLQSQKWAEKCICNLSTLGNHLNSVSNSTKYEQHFCFLVYTMSSSKGKGKAHPCKALRLCTGRTAHRGSRGVAPPFHDDGTRRGWGVSITHQLLFTPGKDPVPIVQEAGWAPRPVWTGVENLAPTGIRFPDRPAHGQSLYCLCYPAHIKF
jgi:hypothetical protein